MTIIMYGIPNCDTIKKAKKWLDNATVDYQFHDYRKQGIPPELVNQFCQALGWEVVVNKRGTTFRQLSALQKEALNAETAVDLLVENPAMIKRPILMVDNQYYIGFKAEQYASIFS
ncbi:ArsC family reductase [Vibrio aestuarianus]|uniref:ArsC family reductase n=1 Tax=Vibrio aestuarianus TaxID=28171 RepID=UPI0021C29F38|nr:ArsC family reductase [Vibrio aestuarianus]MDE1210113.1 ArsC family reductase [Vibrio aestuarianus]MDE1252721.1 ArsC family reductase [Vibrio aestuarianus]MDE1316972.1 ArsC family reductase [Vibrio aestuarianus]CAH8201491.1 putative reductase YffB [Vibrio aestuarianus]